MTGTVETIETACIAAGDYDNFESVLLSDPEVKAKGHTQTEAVNNLLTELKKLNRLNPDGYVYRY